MTFSKQPPAGDIPRDPQVVELLLRYEDSRARGQPVAMAELCRSCPELLPEVEKYVRNLDVLKPFLQATLGHESGRGDTTPLPFCFGRYRILTRLGEGGMGSVYLALDTKLDRKVALKVPHVRGVDSEVLQRFYREARAAATLQHPNICPVHDVGDSDGIPYLTMAYIEGKRLADYIQPGKPLAQRQMAGLVRTLALALEEAHAHGVIHRDLKPGNIMLNSRREPVIMDFGLAQLAHQEGKRLTRLGDTLGTPAYMSPEQVQGQLQVMGPACDIYSLGVILYELLTGRVPFTGPATAVLAQILSKEPPPPSSWRPDVDPRLESICLKAMAKRIGDRYETMKDFAAALGDFLGQPTTGNVGPTSAPRGSALDSALPPTLTAPPLAVAVPATTPVADAVKRRRLIRRASAGLGIAVVLILVVRWLFPGKASDVPGPLPEPTPESALQLSWPADLLRAGKIKAPDLTILKPILHDDFHDPKSGFYQAPNNEAGYRDGKYFLYTNQGGVAWNAPCDIPASFACELVGRVTGDPATAWGFVLDRQDDHAGISVFLTGDGKLRLEPGWFDLETHRGPDVPPATHEAIKRGKEWNSLIAIVRERIVEIYVNGIAVSDPVALDRDVSPGALALAISARPARQEGTAEFARMAVWSAARLPSVLDRGATGKLVPRSAPVPRDTGKMKLVLSRNFARPGESLQGFNNGGDPQQNKTGLTNGEYQILSKIPAQWWGGPGDHLGKIGDGVCFLEGRLAQPGRGGWGLVFGLCDTHDFGVEIKEEGGLRQVRVVHTDHATKATVEVLPWKTVPELRPLTDFNALRLEVAGTQMRLFINGSHIADCKHKQLSPGTLQLWMFAQEPQVDARFRSLRVWTPAEK